jgi:SAM-dependent methyltransferase
MTTPTVSDARRYSPSSLRNRDSILQVVQRHLPDSGVVLEVASGTGEHITHFAAALTQRHRLQFQPSDPDPDARASIDAWTSTLALTNVRPALALDATSETWPLSQADAVLCINMVHISPWASTVGLLRGATRVLSPGGLLYLYGPYRCDGVMVPSNVAFDEELRSQNPAWGIRDLEAITALATGMGFANPAVEPMPANNLSILFRR